MDESELHSSDLNRAARQQQDDQTLLLQTSPAVMDSSVVGKVIGDYEVLSEIARGGMGVVYRARHVKLQREVALKMILAGEFSSPEVVSRFNLEAETAATLDHPGITPIYDIGEHHGQPFFAMRLVEGGSLQSEIKQFESDRRKSASIVAKIARAVHHAHQRGILHRDLKPNNVLLTEDGEPMITDFGLAKMLDRDSGHTKTGAVMGTPAYMAPEQAAGGKNVTTASDIYSLGAILYRLLTGRATYEAEAPLDIVIMSLTEDPTAPRLLCPDLPLELELICLKCLERTPDQRYVSALELANDLERWLSGQPISVRPASLTTLAGIWLRQNLQMAGGAAAIGSACGVLLAVIFFLAGYSSNYYYVGSVYRDYFPSLPQPWLATQWKSSPTFAISVIFSWPVVIAVCGLLTVMWVKPTSRNAAGSVGMIAGVCCAVMMAMSGVIGPQISATIEKTDVDSRLLTAVATDHPDHQRFAQAAIVRRYPDLNGYDPETRARILREKIVSDLLVGLPTGLWLGMCVFLTAAPMIAAGSILAWHLRERCNSTFQWFYRYFDIAFSSSLLLTITILFYVARPLGAQLYVPRPWIAALTVAVLGLAVWAAARNWKWTYRLVVHLLYIALLGVYVAGNIQAPTAFRDAGSLVLAGKYAQAKSRIEESRVVNSDDAWLILQQGVLEVRLGNQAAYAHHCQELVDRGFLSPVPEHSDWAVKLSTLLPVPTARHEELEFLAEKAMVLGQPSANIQWFRLANAMAQYRIGNDTVALEMIDSIDRNYFFLITCTADMVKTLILRKREDPVHAQTVFVDATQWFDEAWESNLDQANREASWLDREVFKTWRAEAAASLNRQSRLND